MASKSHKKEKELGERAPIPRQAEKLGTNNRGREKGSKKAEGFSPNKATELKGLLDLLKLEKEKLVDEMKSTYH